MVRIVHLIFVASCGFLLIDSAGNREHAYVTGEKGKNCSSLDRLVYEQQRTTHPADDSDYDDNEDSIPPPAVRNLTQKLKRLSEAAVTACNAFEVAEELVSLLRSDNTSVLTCPDLFYSMITLTKLANLGGVGSETMQEMFNAVEVLFTASTNAWDECENLYGTLKAILEVFDNITVDFYHEKPRSMLVSKGNFAFSYLPLNAVRDKQKTGLAVMENNEARIITSTDFPGKKVFVYLEAPVTPGSRPSSTSEEHPPGVGPRRRHWYFQNRYATAKFMIYTGNNSLHGHDNFADPCQVKTSPRTPMISASVVSANRTHVYDLKDDAIYFGARLDHVHMSLHAAITCGYLSSDGWRTNGCSTVFDADGVSVCSCSHLSDFAILVESRHADPILCDAVLQRLSNAILLISITSLVLTLLVLNLELLGVKDLLERFDSLRPMTKYILPRSRTPSTPSVLNMASLCLFELFFLLFIDGSHFQLADHPVACAHLAALCYWTLLFYIMWCGFVALKLLQNYYFVYTNAILEKVLNTKMFLLISPVVCLVIVMICWFADSEFFVRNDGSCWIRPDYVLLATFLPLSMLIASDVIITAVLVKSLFFSGSVRQHWSKAARRRTMFTKAFVLLATQFIIGAPWAIQYFTLYTPYVSGAHYAFTFFNGLQGFWISCVYGAPYVLFVIDTYSRTSRLSVTLPIMAIVAWKTDDGGRRYRTSV